MNRWLRRTVLLGVASFGLMGTSARNAWARDPAGAEKLYDDGLKLLDAGDWTNACERFESSYALDPAPGTQLQRAACAEHVGKIALAWSHYKEALTLNADTKSDKQRAEMQSFIDAAIRRLEPRIPYLTIQVAPAVVGASASRDGVATALGVELPIDPGAHVVEIVAPGYASLRREITLAEGAHETVTVALQPAPPAPIATPASGNAAPAQAARGNGAATANGSSGEGNARSESSSGIDGPSDDEGLSGLAMAGLVVGGTGLATLVVSAVTGGLALGKSSDYLALCPTNASGTPVCASPADSDAGVALVSEGESLALVSTVTTFVGVGLAGAGAFLFVLGTSEGEPSQTGSLQLVPIVSPTFAGLGLGGHFE